MSDRWLSPQVLIKGFGVHLRDLCNTTSLEEFVNIADHNVSEMTQKIICQAPADWLDSAESHFLSNLDFLKPIRVRRLHTHVTRAKLEQMDVVQVFISSL